MARRSRNAKPNGTLTLDMSEAEELGTGVHYIELEGGLRALVFDSSVTHGRSASGKSEIIASTQGNARMSDGINIGLNVYRKL